MLQTPLRPDDDARAPAGVLPGRAPAALPPTAHDVAQPFPAFNGRPSDTGVPAGVSRPAAAGAAPSADSVTPRPAASGVPRLIASVAPPAVASGTSRPTPAVTPSPAASGAPRPTADVPPAAPHATAGDGTHASSKPAGGVPLALYADILASRSLAAAAHRLVAAIAREHGCDRVSLGLHRAGATRLVASTALDVADTRAELAQRVAGAMDEALEQGVALTVPSATQGPTSALVTLELALLQRAVGGAVATLPVGVDGEPIGALCLERHATGAAFDAPELERLSALLVLAMPALRWMERADEPFTRRARREVSRAWDALRHPGRRTLRRVLAGAAVALAFLALAPLEQDVGGRARIEGAQQRVVSAPADGFVKTVHVRPGDRVRAGEPLVDLLDADLRLEHDRLSSQLAQHENAYAAAMARSDRVAAATSLAAVGEAQAQLALVDEQLARGRIVAPFDALVIQGDLAQSVGAPVRQGDPLITLATTGHERVIVEVDEVDIARIHPGQAGALALSPLPWSTRTLVVERVAPLAHAVEGRNVFEVQARLTDDAASPRPGLLGHAEIVVGRGPLLAAWLRHGADRLRVAWWNWLGD